MRLRVISEKKGHCPSCGKKFKKDEPYPDVENCEVCERFGPPVKESYEGLEDADEFRDYRCSNPACGSIEEIEICARCGSQWCESCVINRLDDFGIMQRSDPNFEPGMLASCPNCDIVNESAYEGLEDADEFQDHETEPCEWCSADTPINTAVDTDLYEEYEAVAYKKWPHGFHPPWFCCNDCLKAATQSLKKELGIQESYEGLEDADQFEDDRGYDPIWDEFTYRFLGSKSGHEFTFRGNTYHVYTGWGRDGRDVEKDGEVIGNARDEVPWEEFEYNAVGEHLPAQRWTWYELVEQLYNMYGPEDYGDPPPGVGI